MSQLIMSQGKKWLIKSLYFFTVLFTLILYPGCISNVNEKTDLPKLWECEMLFNSLFTANNRDAIRKNYLTMLSLDTNSNTTYLLKLGLMSDRAEEFYCEEYSFQNSDFIVIPELEKDGIEFCIDTNNTIMHMGQIIDKSKVKLSVTHFLGELYSESKNKTDDYIYSDSIDFCIEVFCNKTFMNKATFDWSNYILVLSEIYHSINAFRNFILEDTFNVNSSNVNDYQIEIINKYYLPYIYIANHSLECYLYELPTPR